MQTCIWPSWCHCHSLSLASVKSRLILPSWYWLTWVVPEKGPLYVCVCVCVCVLVYLWWTICQRIEFLKCYATTVATASVVMYCIVASMMPGLTLNDGLDGSCSPGEWYLLLESTVNRVHQLQPVAARLIAAHMPYIAVLPTAGKGDVPAFSWMKLILNFVTPEGPRLRSRRLVTH